MIKQARLQAGFSRKELADKLGITASAISKMENHKTAPSISTLEKVAKATGRTLKVELV